MADDLVKPNECVFSKELVDAIVDFGKKTIALKESRIAVVALLESIFIGREDMIGRKGEIKYHTRNSLSLEKQEILRVTDAFVNTLGKTAEQKALMIERAKIGRELNKIYLDLLNATFPPEEDARLPSSDTKKPPSTPNTPMDSLASSTKSSIPMDSLASATNNSLMNMEDLSSAIGEILPQKSRTNYQKTSFPKQVETDLFETPVEITEALGEYVETIASAKLTVLEPSAGHGAIVKVLESKGIKVIAQDKYTMPVSIDFLTSPIPVEAQVIVANPPLNLKWQFLAKFLESGLPFFVLLTLDTISAKKFTKMIGKRPFDLIILNGKSHFLHAGRLRDVGACAWYAFFPEATGKMTLVRIGAHDDIELGDEDSDGGRDYDSDEKECEDLDNAILNDPKSKFTKEGYLVDGVTKGDDEIEDEDYEIEE